MYRQDLLGTNRAGATDPNGVKHIERMIGIARDGGGPVYYITGNPGATTGRSSRSRT